MEPLWTGARLRKKAQKYFDAITTREPMLREVPVCIENDAGELIPALDEFGHRKMKFTPVIAADGTEVQQTIWLSPPSLSGLCLALGVSQSTFNEWCSLDEKEPGGKGNALCRAAKEVRAKIEAYYVEKSLEKGAARGAIANLEANFGWKRRREVGFDEKTRETVGSVKMNAEDRLALLREMGLTPPWEKESE